MEEPKMKSLFVAIALVTTAGSISTVSAQTYPSHPVTMVVPFSAGGPLDTLARIVSVPMSRALGQTVIVENITGAAGTIGVARVVRATPDGYTLGIGNWSSHVVNGAVYPLQYDLLKDLDPVAMVASNPQLVVTKSAVPAKDLKELIAWLKANPDKASAGTAGAGSASHVGGVY